MPDADKIGNISRRWSKMYKKVCEGHFDSATLADDAMNPLRKDIGNYGNSMFSFLKKAFIHLEDIRNNPLFFHVHNWNEEDYFIRDLASTYYRRYRLNQRGINIAISAYKDLVHGLRNGEFMAGDLHKALLQAYIRRVYDSNFADKVIFNVVNQPDMDCGAIRQRLNEMGNSVDENIDILASQIARKGRMGHVQRIHSIPLKAITIEDDVFSLGNNK